MDINGVNSQAIKGYLPQTERPEGVAGETATKSKGARPGGEGDTLRLSHEAKLHTTARGAAMQADDVRQERVDALKAQVAEGSYHIDSEKIAVKLLQEEAELFS